jgi:hypothetical protein
MLAASDPNLIIGDLALGALALAALWRLVVWIRDAPVRPDPWDGEAEKQLQSAPETCPHCSTPQPPTAWFCEHCGRAVGPYNNLMPFLNVFSEGEVLRNGTGDRLRKSPLIVIGYFLISFNIFTLGMSLGRSSAVLSGVTLLGLLGFWFALFKNFYRSNPK